MLKKSITGLLVANMVLSIFIFSSVSFASEIQETKSSTEESTIFTNDVEDLEGEVSSVVSSDSTEMTESPVTSFSSESMEDQMEDENYTDEVPEEIDEFSYPEGRSELSISPSMFSRAANLSIADPTLPRSNFIDVSSHNGVPTVDEFRIIRSYGVTGVSVKLTEGTSYQNPYAKDQIKNAKEAGLVVSAYHYSWFTTEAQAKKEAKYFADMAIKVGLPKTTLMVNDLEDSQLKYKNNHTKNSLAFENQLIQLGFKKVNHYIGLHWINENRIDPVKLGLKKIWVAAYPTTPTNQLFTEYGAWQWTSKMTFPKVKGVFDMSTDYAQNYPVSLALPPQGKAIKDNRYVKVSQKGSNTWSNFDWKYRQSTDALYGQMFQARVRYQHMNGSTYFSLYDSNGKWYGYIDSNEVTVLSSGQGKYSKVGKYVSISSNNDTIWGDLNFQKIRNTTQKTYQKTYLAKGKYEHFNGNEYYSLYDGQNKWVGYLDTRATKEISNSNGMYIADGRYVTIINKSLKTYSDFKGTVRKSGQTYYQRTYLAKGRYENFNGITYLSIYSNKGAWLGYINKNDIKFSNSPQGAYIADGRYATVKVANKNTFSDFGITKRLSTKKMYQKTYQIKGRYRHFDGTLYYSLYNHQNKWQGYVKGDTIKFSKTASGPYIKYGKKVKITKSNYTMWGNFNWTKKKGASNKYIGKSILAKGLYNHANGTSYYSLYNDKGTWLGYLDTNATK